MKGARLRPAAGVFGRHRGSDVDEYLSTKHLAWLLGRSSTAVRRMIREGEVQAVRLPGGFKVPREEVLRVSREQIEHQAGRKVSDGELERLADDVIARNETITES
jgi:excisionase family DNA binding protein